MAWNREQPPIFEGEDELQLKLQYAGIVARNPERRLTAGYEVFPGPENYGRALQAQSWLYDPFVVAEVERLTGEEAVGEILPSKEAVAKEILDFARETHDGKDKIGAFKLFAEVMGHIAKVPSMVQDNRVINVLRVPTRDLTPEDDADFNARFYAQQTKLVADARSNRAA